MSESKTEILYCPTCNAEVANDADKCPACFLRVSAFKLFEKNKELFSVDETKKKKKKKKKVKVEEVESRSDSANGNIPEELLKEVESVYIENLDIDDSTLNHMMAQMRRDALLQPNPDLDTKIIGKIPGSSVLQENLTAEVGYTIGYILKQPALIKVYRFARNKADNPNILYLWIDEYLYRFQECVMQALGNRLEGQDTVLWLAIQVKAYQLLGDYIDRFASKGINPKFIKNWMMKRILGTIVGWGEYEIDTNIQMQGVKPSDYLVDHIGRLLPETGLARILPIEVNTSSNELEIHFPTKGNVR